MTSFLDRCRRQISRAEAQPNPAATVDAPLASLQSCATCGAPLSSIVR